MLPAFPASHRPGGGGAGDADAGRVAHILSLQLRAAKRSAVSRGSARVSGRVGIGAAPAARTRGTDRGPHPRATPVVRLAPSVWRARDRNRDAPDDVVAPAGRGGGIAVL